MAEISPEDVLLREGATYVFAASFKEQRNRYSISAPSYDRELITTDGSLGIEELRSLSERNGKVQALRAAMQAANR